MAPVKILIIRFSSFGDIAQALFCVPLLRRQYPECQIHWVTRDDYADFLGRFSQIEKVWSLPRGSGLGTLGHLARQLRGENFDLIYDAHSNLRSTLLKIFLRKPFCNRIVTRSKNRLKRFLLFKLGWNLFPNPFRGGASFCAPLGFTAQESRQAPPPLISATDSHESPEADYIVLAPNAAWPLKMWPLEYWQTLIKQNPQRRFLVTGGPGDADPATLEAFAPDNCRSLAGKLSWSQTLDLIQGAKAVIGVDTGTVHLGDLLGVPTFFLIGPTAFGFPTRSSSGVLEIPLSCRPCTKDGRGQCKIAETKKCLVDIRPDMVTARLAAL